MSTRRFGLRKWRSDDTEQLELKLKQERILESHSQRQTMEAQRIMDALTSSTSDTVDDSGEERKSRVDARLGFDGG